MQVVGGDGWPAEQPNGGECGGPPPHGRAERRVCFPAFAALQVLHELPMRINKVFCIRFAPTELRRPKSTILQSCHLLLSIVSVQVRLRF